MYVGIFNELALLLNIEDKIQISQITEDEGLTLEHQETSKLLNRALNMADSELEREAILSLEGTPADSPLKRKVKLAKNAMNNMAPKAFPVPTVSTTELLPIEKPAGVAEGTQLALATFLNDEAENDVFTPPHSRRLRAGLMT